MPADSPRVPANSDHEPSAVRVISQALLTAAAARHESAVDKAVALLAASLGSGGGHQASVL